jgi:hypothetical protein
MVISGVVAVVVLGAGWVKVVSPERKKVTAADAQIATARSQLQSAQSELSQAQQAEQHYAEAYASIVALGKAVPTSTQTPALLYELDQATGRQKVQFSTFAPAAASSSSPTAAAAGGFQTVPFSFTFSGNFARLYALLNTLQGFAVQMPTGSIEVTGRLMSIQSLSLTPASASGGGSGSKTPGAEELTGTISATAYVLPVSVALPSAPAPSSTTPSTAAGASSSTTTPAPAAIKAVP